MKAHIGTGWFRNMTKIDTVSLQKICPQIFSSQYAYLPGKYKFVGQIMVRWIKVRCQEKSDWTIHLSFQMLDNLLSQRCHWRRQIPLLELCYLIPSSQMFFELKYFGLIIDPKCGVSALHVPFLVKNLAFLSRSSLVLFKRISFMMSHGSHGSCDMTPF